MKIRDDYTCPLEIAHDIIKGKWKTYDGYPLRVEYSITQRRGRKMIEAIDILQMIGVDYMVERGLTDSLVDKGILSAQEIEMIKGGNEEDIKCLIAKCVSGGYIPL